MKHAPILKCDPSRAREGDPLVAVWWRHIGRATSNYVHELIAADGPVIRRTCVNRRHLWAFPRFDDRDGRFTGCSWSSVRTVTSLDGVPGIKVVELFDVNPADLPGDGARMYILHRRDQLAGKVTT